MSRSKTITQVRTSVSQPAHSNSQQPRKKVSGLFSSTVGPASRTRSVFNRAAEFGIDIDETPYVGLDSLRDVRAFSEPGVREQPIASMSTSITPLTERGRLPSHVLRQGAVLAIDTPPHLDGTGDADVAPPPEDIASSSTPPLRKSQASIKKTGASANAKSAAKKKPRSKSKKKAKTTPKTTAAARSLIEIMKSSSPENPSTSNSNSSQHLLELDDEIASAAGLDAALAHVEKDVNFLQDDINASTPPPPPSPPTQNKNSGHVRKASLGLTGKASASSIGRGGQRRFGSIQTNTYPSTQIEISNVDFDHFFPDLADF